MKTKPVIALSTCWCSDRYTDGYRMLCEMADLGFEYVELSHGIRISLVPGILQAVRSGVVRLSSTHNFCPLPPGVLMAAPNIFQPSSPEHQETEMWLRYTRKSLDFASQVGAKVLIMHLGSVSFVWSSPVAKLRSYVRQVPQGTAPGIPAYQDLLNKSKTRLARRMGPYWERTRANLEQVMAFAAERGIKLGLENREKFDELPRDEDWPEFLKSLTLPGVAGYWHDTGHAQIKTDLGLISHKQHLDAVGDRLLGFHLHDVNAESRDHQALGTGRVDFDMVSQYFRPHHIFVLELSPGLSTEEIVSSRDRLRELIAAAPGMKG